MSKNRKLLNESTIRRFGQLANVDSSIVSNFIKEMVEDEEVPMDFPEEEADDEVPMDFPEEDAEEEIPMDFPEEEVMTDAPADLASKVIQAVADALEIQIDIVGGDSGGDSGDELGGDLELADDELGGDLELADDELGGDLELADDELGDELEEAHSDRKSFDALVSAVLQEIESSKAPADAEITDPDDPDDPDDNNEEMVQEVLRRVKSRIAAIRNKKA